MAKQFLTGFEREALHQVYQDYECSQCSEPITNPICHDCLGKQILSWLALYPNIKKKMAPKLKKYIQEVNNDAIGSIGCASCNNKKAALCPYCFTEAVYNMFRKNNIDRMIVMDFLSTFNFDLKHEGYINEAISGGLY